MILIQHLVEHTVVVKLALASDLDQSGFGEDFQVARDRRLRHREVPHQLPTTRSLLSQQSFGGVETASDLPMPWSL